MSYNVTANSQSSVNATKVVADWLADVVALKDGGWISYSGYGSTYYHALFQRFTSDGAEKGDQVWVKNQNSALFPDSVAALADGGWVATYYAYVPGGPTWTPYRMDVFQQRYDADGDTVGNITRVNTFKNLEQGWSESVGLKDGGWVVVWQSNMQDGYGAGLYQQRYSKAGTKVGGEVRVNTTTSEAENSGEIASLSDGGWIVSWSVGSYTDSKRGIFTQRYDKSGHKVGGETRVTDAKMDKYESVVTGLSKGGWVVTWVASDFADDAFGNEIPGRHHGVYQQRYDANGKKIGAAGLVNTPGYDNQYSYEPDTAALSDGGWVTVWAEKSATGLDIYQQRFSASGAKIGTELRVNTHTAGDQSGAKITAFANGSWLVSWSGAGPGDDQGVHQRYFAADISGNSSANTLTGTKWSETLRGNAGNDTLNAGSGNDVLVGGAGKDKLNGGAGTDTASYEGSTRGVVASLQKPSGNTNDAEGDTYVSIERLKGTSHDDTLIGNDVANRLMGEGGADKLYGGAGGDVLESGLGNDLLKGEAGNDTLSGGVGADKLYGGTGTDTFVFQSVKDTTVAAAGRDKIYDFSRSEKDKIDLGGIDANTKAGGNQSFAFIGTEKFGGNAGELRYQKKDGNTYIYGDVNGDGEADFSILAAGSLTLGKTDFVL